MIFIILFIVTSVSCSRWSVLIGCQRWQAMKHTSPIGRFLTENLNRRRVLGSALSLVTSSLGLFSVMALFKEIEQALDPSDSVGRATLAGLIHQVNLKIKNSARKKSNSIILVESCSVQDFSWIAIAILCISTSCFASCCLLPFLKKFFELRLEAGQQPTMELVEVTEQDN